MTNYRRKKNEGGYYFFTVVTCKRRRFLTDKLARDCLREVWKDVQDKRYFEVIALVLIPDHLHCVWRLENGDNDYSGRWSTIKKKFSRIYLANGGEECTRNDSRLKKRERGIWQRRFWEHRIRDEDDLKRHVDYIHYNPVKHNLVDSAEEWYWSTFHKYVRRGHYGHNYFNDYNDEGFCKDFTGEWD